MKTTTKGNRRRTAAERRIPLGRFEGLERFGRSGGPCHLSLDLGDEGPSETWSQGLIPGRGFDKLGLGFLFVEDGQHVYGFFSRSRARW